MNQTYIIEEMKVQNGSWFAVGKIGHEKLYCKTSENPKENWGGQMCVSREIGQDMKFRTNRLECKYQATLIPKFLFLSYSQVKFSYREKSKGLHFCVKLLFISNK